MYYRRSRRDTQSRLNFRSLQERIAPKLGPKSSLKFKILSRLLTAFLICVVGFVALTVAVIIYFTTQVPSPDNLRSRFVSQSTKIFDNNNELLYDIFTDQNRTPIELKDIPDSVKKATISIEDKDFYNHGGFSVTGILRSAFDLVIHRQIEGGGSTLTQQLVKNAILTSDQSIVRKIKELILAIQVERVFTKDQILEMYLNEIPYGGTAYGIEAASNLYFGKHAKELNLAESSLLAGLPQLPSVYSPYGRRPELAKVRQAEVLRRMVEDGYITKDEAEAAKNAPLSYRTSQTEAGIKAPHFVEFVKEKLIEKFGEPVVESGGLKVTTSLDYKLQQKVQDIVKTEVDNLKSAKVGNGAALVINPKNGQVLAYVGSKDYFAKDYDGQFDVVRAPRQPGSATKPITYATGMQKGYTAASVLMDVKTDFVGGSGTNNLYQPVNYDGKFRGPVQVRYALANSLNIPAVKMLANVSIKSVMDLGNRMGLESWQPTQENIDRVGLSLTLGGREVKLLDLTQAFAVFADNGNRVDIDPIIKVEDQKGKVIYDANPGSGKKILDSGITYIISNILADNSARAAAFGTNSVLVVPGRTVSVKTGTTDLKRDNWTIGYTPSRVVGVWVGNNDNTIMDPSIASGVTGASPIWQKIMIQATKDLSDEKFDQPDNVSKMDIDGLMGGKTRDGSPTRSEYFVKGTEPQSVAGAYQRQKVCKNNTHRISGDGEDGEDKDVIMLTEKDPTGANKWQAGIDGWALTASDSRFVGAARGCTGIPGFNTPGNGSQIIEIVNISNGANVPKTFDILAKANSPKGVKKVTWSVDGSVVSVQTAEPYAHHVDFPASDKSTHSVNVELEDNEGGKFNTAINVVVSL